MTEKNLIDFEIVEQIFNSEIEFRIKSHDERILYLLQGMLKAIQVASWKRGRETNPLSSTEKKFDKFDKYDNEIWELEMTMRSYNALIADGITNLNQLAKTPLSELKKIPRLGVKSIAEIVDTLKQKGITLK